MSSDYVVDVVCMASGFVRLTNRNDSPYWLAADHIMVVTADRKSESNSMIGMYSGEDFFAKENVETVFRAIAEAKGELSTFEPVQDDAYALRKELDATRAELAAERAKPRGGVAWALKRHGFDLYLGHGDAVLYLSKEDAEKARKDFLHPDAILVVPHAIGDGADELKAAIERAEKAEAEVAAWKGAANLNSVMDIVTPIGLTRRLTEDKDNLDNASATIASLALKAAEVPPLDKWRVLATVAEMAYKAADFDFAKAVCLQMSVAEWKESKPYPLKD